MQEVKFPFYVQLALILLSIAIIIYLLYLGQSVFIPLFFAFFSAILLYPLAKFLETKGVKRWLSSLLAVIVFIAVLTGFLYFIAFQINNVLADIPLIQKRAMGWIQHAQRWIADTYNIDEAKIQEKTARITDGIFSNGADQLGRALTQASTIAFGMIIIFIFTYFILFYRRLLFNFLQDVFPEQHRLKVRHVILGSRAVTNSYMVGLLIEFAVVATINCILFTLLGIKYGLLLGLLAALMNIVPYLGIFTAIVLVWMVTIIYSTATVAFQAAGLLLILHILDVNILLPRIVGQRVRMNTLITIVVVLMGGILWGVAGLFLAVPTMAIIKIVFEHVEQLKPWAYLMGTESKSKRELEKN